MTIPFRPTGLTLAAGALRYWERRQEVSANNLANASTDGFKAERVFARAMEGELPAADAVTDLRAGTLRPTGNPLDFALRGDGFLIVQTPQGERLTRGGAFRIDADRRLVDANGNPLLGDRGPITLPENVAEVQVAADGSVRAVVGGERQVDQSPIDRLRVMMPVDKATLRHEEGSRWRVDGAVVAVKPQDARVEQGALEDSNVSSIGAIVDMIAIQRAYAAAQKAITTLDAVRGTAANDIGKPV